MKKIFVILLVLFTLNSFAQTTPVPASDVLKAAYAQAKAEHKDVIVMFHASWCIWCKKMEASINDSLCQKAFKDNYVVTYIDILENKGNEGLENAGGTDVMKSFNGDPKGGIPFWVVLDADGKPIGTSYAPPADGTPATAKNNVGCPAEVSEVAYFIKLLKASSNMTDDQLTVIKNRFLQNKQVRTHAS